MAKIVKFEDALNKLENIVDKFESGQLSLDEMMKKYEEGSELAKICLKQLELADKKIKVLNANGTMTDNIDPDCIE